MTDKPVCTDYDLLTAADARELIGISSLPHELRVQAIAKAFAGRGEAALIELLSQVIGLANSVVANNREMIELYLITEEGYSDRLAEKIKLPTIAGALKGVELAGGIDPAKLCYGCAFRRGSIANQSPITTDDADWCAQGEGVFSCHEDLDEKGQPTRGCAGYAQAARRERRKWEDAA